MPGEFVGAEFLLQNAVHRCGVVALDEEHPVDFPIVGAAQLLLVGWRLPGLLDRLEKMRAHHAGLRGQVRECGPRAAFPLSLQHVNTYVKERLALIGDAAHTIHPLAGQGVNLGLLDAAALSEVLCGAQDKKQDIGAFHVLRRYERWRKGDNLMIMAVMDGFKRLFGSSFEPLRALRNTGLNLTNIVAPVKNQIMLHAMGFKGDLPRLARPC